MRELFLCKSCGFESDVKLRVLRADRAPICKLCHGRVTKAKTKEALKPNDTIRLENSSTESAVRTEIKRRRDKAELKKELEQINKEYELGY